MQENFLNTEKKAIHKNNEPLFLLEKKSKSGYKQIMKQNPYILWLVSWPWYIIKCLFMS